MQMLITNTAMLKEQLSNLSSCPVSSTLARDLEFTLDLVHEFRRYLRKKIWKQLDLPETSEHGCQRLQGIHRNCRIGPLGYGALRRLVERFPISLLLVRKTPQVRDVSMHLAMLGSGASVRRRAPPVDGSTTPRSSFPNPSMNCWNWSSSRARVGYATGLTVIATIPVARGKSPMLRAVAHATVARPTLGN